MYQVHVQPSVLLELLETCLASANILSATRMTQMLPSAAEGVLNTGAVVGKTEFKSNKASYKSQSYESQLQINFADRGRAQALIFDKNKQPSSTVNSGRGHIQNVI